MLVWTLFREECGYYKGLLKVCDMLDQQEVHIIRDSITANVCCWITWAILSKGRSFFNTVLVEAQFCRGKHFKWPTSLIHKITDDICFAKPIAHPFYPAEWLISRPQMGRGWLATTRVGEAIGGGTLRGQTKNQTRDNNLRGKTTAVEEGIAANLGWTTATHASLP
jgi:hypothetical protein